MAAAVAAASTAARLPDPRVCRRWAARYAPTAGFEGAGRRGCGSDVQSLGKPIAKPTAITTMLTPAMTRMIHMY
ncbi:hypothetical protein [Nocardia panacis]|uniref:hypothetical protein n=1 Tax=Nocardia panacis TaxID=2340916 RepID=UPI0011C35678|nr:hypothetical protein [Nocardia panacis]